MIKQILLLTGAFFFATHPTALADKASATPKPVIAGKVSVVRGTPQIVRQGKTFTAEKAQEIWEGDQISTDPKSRLKAKMADDTLLSVGSKSSLTIDKYAYASGTNRRTAKLRAAFGVFRVWVTKKVQKDSSFEVVTPTAVAGVRGTQFMGIVSDTTSAIASVEGRVAVRNANADIKDEVTLLDGQGTDVGENASPTAPVTWGNARLFQLLQDTE